MRGLKFGLNRERGLVPSSAGSKPNPNLTSKREREFESDKISFEGSRKSRIFGSFDLPKRILISNSPETPNLTRVREPNLEFSPASLKGRLSSA